MIDIIRKKRIKFYVKFIRPWGEEKTKFYGEQFVHAFNHLSVTELVIRIELNNRSQ
jgi:hypothetical protein